MHPENPFVASAASTRSSEAWPPDFGLTNTNNPSSKSTGGMATSNFQPDRAPPNLPDENRPSPDDRPSDDSTTFRGNPQFGSIRSQRGRKPSNADSTATANPQFPRLDFDFGGDDRDAAAPAPLRNPSRQGQVMRYGPQGPPSEYGWDEEPRYHPRPPYDYGRPMRTGPSYGYDYWDEPYYNRPYRRPSTIRESQEWNGSRRGGPPRPPPRSRYRPHFEDPSEEDGESDEQPLRAKARRKKEQSQSPPPEVIMRLPFTEWMNKSARSRTYFSCMVCCEVSADT